MNKKGMTLLELLVSVALISAIMIFMYKLISDVRNEKKEIDKLTNNSIKINEIEAKIQKTILEYNLNKIIYSNSSTPQYLIFYLRNHPVAQLYLSNDGTIELKINNLTGIERERIKWKLSNILIENVCYEINEYKNLANYKIFLSNNNIIEIPIYNDELSMSGTKCENK